MRVPFVSIAVVSVSFGILGCGGSGGSSDTATPNVGPHGGLIVALADVQGLAEVTVEPEPGKGAKSRVSVYFLTEDAKSPLKTKPTVVRVKFRTPGKDEPEDLVMEPKPDTKSATGASRYVSKPGDYLGDQLYGELAATIDGHEVGGAFSRSQ